MLRKARSIKNRFPPISQIPPETLALAAGFLSTERDLINATAVCQQWRSVLLSFPRLWCNAGGSPSKLEAYLERSKSVPLEVTLSTPQLVVSIIPHASRLTTLTVYMDRSPNFDQIAEHLRDPIPTLRSLTIRGGSQQLRNLELPSGLREGLFRHLKILSLKGFSSFSGPQTFPNITELFLCTNVCASGRVIDLLNTLEQLPGLVKVSIVFHIIDWYIDSPNIVTLPCLQEIHLSASIPDEYESGSTIMPPILRYLELPKATSITLESNSFDSSDSILPITSFGERLPNYAELSELRIDTTMYSGTVIFRSPSQAVFTYITESLRDYDEESRLWGGLPVSSVRRVTAILGYPVPGDENEWLVGMLENINFLELLELGGDCSRALGSLRRRLVRGAMQIDIRTLIVRGGGYAESQALMLENVKDDIGLQNMTVTYILDPDAYERAISDPDLDSSSDGKGWGEGSGDDSHWSSDHDDDDDDEWMA